MNATSPQPSDRVAVSRRGPTTRTLVLVVVFVAAAGLLGWEYHMVRQRDTSLSRLKQELNRRQQLNQRLQRDEVGAFLVGSPSRQSESGMHQIDYYTWRGLIHQSHISLEFDADGKVFEIGDAIFAGEAPVAHKSPPIPTRKAIPPEEVEAALARAEEIYRQSGDVTREFHETLQSVYEGLPEAKVSTEKGRLTWNTFRFPCHNRKLFAIRFAAPQSQAVDLDYVHWVNWVEDSDLISLTSKGNEKSESEKNLESKRFDVEPNFQAEGLEPVDRAAAGSLSLKCYSPEKQFILWYFTGDSNSNPNLELKVILYLSESGQQPLRIGFEEIANYIGLQTNLPKFAPTPDGVRNALTALDQRMASELIGLPTSGRLLRPVMQALPEVEVSTVRGESRWQKIDFPHGPCTAVKIRVPDSVGKKVDLYGALVCAQIARFGWDNSGTALGEFNSRSMPNGQLSEISIPPPQNVALFSHAYGMLDGGQEFAIWLRLLDSAEPERPEAFITLTAVAHDETKDSSGLPHASTQPWTCGQLLGVTVPRPAAPENCTVLGWHEQNLSRIIVTPDSRRLISVGVLGEARIWNLETKQLEGSISLPVMAAREVVVGPDNKTMLAVDYAAKTVQIWNLDSREIVTSLGTTVTTNGGVDAAAFGPTSDRLAVLERKNDTLREHEHVFAIHDLIGNRPPTLSPVVRESAGNNYHSLVYLPTVNLFAAGKTQMVFDASSPIGKTSSSVVLWSSDFTKVEQELPLADHPIQFQGQELNPVRLSYHPNGRRLAAICGRGHLKVWDVGTWTELLSGSFEAKPDPELWYKPPSMTALLNVSISANGGTVATTGPRESGVTLWNVANGERSIASQADEIPVTHVTHSSDGKWVATANTDGVIRLWKNSE